MEIYDRARLSIPTIAREEIAVENAVGRFSAFCERACSKTRNSCVRTVVNEFSSEELPAKL